MKMISIALSAMTAADKLSLSGVMLLRGMGTVFMVLIILWFVLGIFGKVFGGAEKNAEKQTAPAKPQKKEAPKAAEQTKNAPAAAPAPVSAPAAAQDDTELIAVITAAIAAYQSASGQSCLPFRVVSFTRKNNASGWMGNSADNQ